MTSFVALNNCKSICQLRPK